MISDPLGGQSFYLLPSVWLIAELSVHLGPRVPLNTAPFRSLPNQTHLIQMSSSLQETPRQEMCV